MADEDQKLASDPAFRRVITALAGARNVLVLSGAGISAESNIPTFRGEGGWWRSLNPASLATLAAFKKDPKLVWEFYEYRRHLVANASPNKAHRALAELESPDRNVFIVTQNVDDLHERAGSHGIVHVHGSIWAASCLKDGATYEDPCLSSLRSVPAGEFCGRGWCGSMKCSHALLWRRLRNTCARLG
jgi:NAD-dependent deacetylase